MSVISVIQAIACTILALFFAALVYAWGYNNGRIKGWPENRRSNKVDDDKHWLEHADDAGYKLARQIKPSNNKH